MKQKQLAIIGSTGSIGTQALSVVSEHPERFGISVLVAGRKVDTLVQQALRYRPKCAIIADESLLWKLRNGLEGSGIECAAGALAIEDAMTRPDIDTVLTATVGYSGLAPTLRAIRAGKEIALANKETLVVAGDIVTEAAKQHGVKIYPVDSEHSAIYQCIRGEDPSRVRRLIVTASGGPFLHTPADKLATVTVADALHHPNWSMGAKITIDSATMVNKAFEIIEARWLFDLPGDKITAVVHPQSIVHSMVEMTDGAVMAQLGTPDMKLPIRLALAGGERLDLPEGNDRLDWSQMLTLTFEQPDRERFPGIELGHYALSRGGTTACVINAANEVAVDAFLHDRIRYVDIIPVIHEALVLTPHISHPSYDDYVAVNALSRVTATEIINKIKHI